MRGSQDGRRVKDGRRHRRARSKPQGRATERWYAIIADGPLWSDRFERTVKRRGGQILQRGNPCWLSPSRSDWDHHFQRQKPGHQRPRLSWNRYRIGFLVRGPAGLHRELARLLTPGPLCYPLPVIR